MHAHRRQMAVPIEQHEQHVTLQRYAWGTLCVLCVAGVLWCMLDVRNFFLAVPGAVLLAVFAVFTYIFQDALS